MSANTLRDLFIDELKDMYDAEQRIAKAYPKLVDAAESESLSSALQEHLDQTEEHVSRLEEIFGMFDEPPTRKSCRAMIGLLEEGEELMREDGTPGIRDAALIAAAKKVEHYEMATYECLRAWANRLGEDEVTRMLEQTLDEIGQSTQELSSIADTIEAGANGGNGRATVDMDDELPRGRRANDGSMTSEDEDAESSSDSPSRRSTGRARAQKRR